MSITIGDAKNNLASMLHGGSLNKVRFPELMFERAANTMLSEIDPVDTEKDNALANVVHDDVYNYALPTDYKKLIDLYPQDDRQSDDVIGRRGSEPFDLRKNITNKNVSIEGSDGSKIIRINWRSRSGKVLNSMNSLTANGTWSVVGTASGLVADSINKVSGSASIRFDLAASGDGIQNTTMTAVDLTNEDEVADIFTWVYIGDTTNLTSISAVWGNDLTANYWTSVAQTTQADGTAFKVGWNLIKFAWSTATETGTVAPSTIDSFKLTIDATGAMSNIRVDNIMFSIGRNFDIKYYSKYLLKNTAGEWISRTTDDQDIIVLDNDAIQIYLLECLIASAQQAEGQDSGFDMNWATGKLEVLYKKYKKEYPSKAKKEVGLYGSSPARGRW